MKVKGDEINLASDLDKILSDQDKKLLNSVLASLKEKYDFDKTLTLSLSEAKENKDFLPGSIFNKEVGIFESIVKFLYENKNLSFKEISRITKRSTNNISVTYNNARRKHKNIFESDYSVKIPFTIFSKKYTCFESVCLYLKQKMNYHDIAVLLERDDRTIWTTYQRAVKKQKKGEEK